MYVPFLQALFEHGRVVVGTGEPSAEDLQAGDRVLAEMEARNRLDGPADLPKYERPTARWAAMTVYQSCRLIAIRAISAEEARDLLPPPPVNADTAADHYSADLTLRFLPDVLRLAEEQSQADPVCKMLRALAHQWPLSSVGIRDLEVNRLRLEPVRNCPSLLSIYLDRIVRARDASRLKSEPIRAAYQQRLGAYPELQPEVLRLLAPIAAGDEPRETSEPQ